MSTCVAIALLTEIRELLSVKKELDHKRAIKTAQQSRYRAKKRKTKSVVDTTQSVDTTKEEGKGKENASPTPPIREKGKGEERLSSSTGAREGIPPVFDIHSMPTLEQFKVYIRRYKYADEAWCVKWYEENSQQFQWSAANGEKFRNWTRYFDTCYKREHAKNAGGGSRGGSVHADNWRPTPKEDIEHVF